MKFDSLTGSIVAITICLVMSVSNNLRADCFVKDSAPCRDFQGIFGYVDSVCHQYKCIEMAPGETTCESANATPYSNKDTDYYYTAPNGQSGRTSLVETPDEVCVHETPCDGSNCISIDNEQRCTTVSFQIKITGTDIQLSGDHCEGW